jgi:hypothetical protein
MRKNDRGLIGVLEIIILVAVLAAVGFVGWRVYSSNEDKAEEGIQSVSVTESADNSGNSETETPDDFWLFVNEERDFQLSLPSKSLQERYQLSIDTETMWMGTFYSGGVGGGCATFNWESGEFLVGTNVQDDSAFGHACTDTSVASASVNAVNTQLYATGNGDAGWVGKSFIAVLDEETIAVVNYSYEVNDPDADEWVQVLDEDDIEYVESLISDSIATFEIL